ncbi:GNAT family N-acetyltransferase [Pseudactinotalea sp.]|uniref:GNAT family N-acetyltransferase n=1 Tax=Pseudactinotalea sp. TaxID=1926260 RepID=UPI003B3B781B
MSEPGDQRDLEIRPCTPSDLPGLTAAEPPGADIAVRLFARQQRGESVYLLAVASGVVVGHGELMLGANPELRHLQVDPESRGQGVGTSIVRAAERHLGTGRLSIGVGLDNSRARRLYERLGYVGTGEISTTTYTYVDHEGPHVATESDERLVKSLPG